MSTLSAGCEINPDVVELLWAPDCDVPGADVGTDVQRVQHFVRSSILVYVS